MALHSGASYVSVHGSPYLRELELHALSADDHPTGQHDGYRNNIYSIQGVRREKGRGSRQDPWKRLNDLVEKHDNDECRNWTEEIQNLLIFTGLFAATVTAFAVESFQWLRDDDNTEILTAILANMTNGTMIAETSTKPYQVRVNTFWFLSLILSLSTVLIGILCLQWLREFQRDAAMLPKDAIPIRQLRYRGLRAWKVPRIISTLPILLQVAVVLFFLGILDLLWNLHRSVAYAVTVVVSLSLAVLFFTAAAPALQALTITRIDPQRIITQCPYKSPQAWLIYLALQPCARGLRFISRGFVTLKAYAWSARDYGVKRCMRMIRRGNLLNSLRQRLGEEYAWIHDKNTGQFEGREAWLELDGCWHNIQGNELLEQDTVDGISWIMNHFGHRLDVFGCLAWALDDLDEKTVKRLVHKRIAGDFSEGNNECLSLAILHQLPIHQSELLKSYLNERLIRCINRTPVLSARLFEGEGVLEPFFKQYYNDPAAFPSADPRALIQCLTEFSYVEPHSHIPFWVLTHPLRNPTFSLFRDDGNLDRGQIQSCFHTLNLFASLLDGGRRDNPGSAELLSSNSHRNWLGRCLRQLMTILVTDEAKRRWEEQDVWKDFESLVGLVDAQLARHWSGEYSEEWIQWVAVIIGRDVTTPVVYASPGPIYHPGNESIDRGHERSESAVGYQRSYRNDVPNDPPMPTPVVVHEPGVSVPLLFSG